MQYNAKASESYENFSLQDAQLSTAQQYTKPTAEDDMNMQRNPSYSAVGKDDMKMQRNPSYSAVGKDNMNMQRNPSYSAVGKDDMIMQRNPSYSAVGNPQVKPEAEDNANMEDDIYFNVQ